jgi:N-acetylglucosamine malate deacetylase 1
VSGEIINWAIRMARPHWVRDRAKYILEGIERFGPMERIELPPGRRLTVVAPHPDDESVGCGGLISLWAAERRQAEVLFLTAGETGAAEVRDPMTTAARRKRLGQELRQTRRAEAEAALATLGASGAWLDGTDGALHRDEARLADKIAELWRANPPDLITAPDPGDRHPDHAVAARIVGGAALSVLPPETPLLAYEVWSPAPANAVLDITAFAETKWRAIAAHRSQTATTDYLAAARALNCYRAITSGQRQGYAEAFRRTTVARYADDAERLRL